MNDPYAYYKMMLEQHPVYRDEAKDVLAVYTYKDCKAVLNDPRAQIPSAARTNNAGWNEHILSMRSRFARLSNGQAHDIARQTALFLFDNRKDVLISEVLEELLRKESGKPVLDWVYAVCRQLPVRVILKSFGFSKEDSDFILDKISLLVKIMSPAPAGEDIEALNEISGNIYAIMERQLRGVNFYTTLTGMLCEKYGTKQEEAIALCVSNLAGLFIQGYDAGRGVLSNSLLQLLRQDGSQREYFTDKSYLKKSITETLRYDPPVHNTRRVAAEDMMLSDIPVKKGEAILIVLAAANRDPLQFRDPGVYDIERPNNADHLTFGDGAHRCIAGHFMVSLATAVLSCLFERYPEIRLLEENIQYEPSVNLRLPVSMRVSL